MVLDINILENKKRIEFIIDRSNRDISYIYLDSFENADNYLSQSDNDHEHKLDASEILVSETLHKGVYSFNADVLGKPRLKGLYIMSFVFTDGETQHKILFDLHELYCVRMNCITSCDPCQDNASKRMLTVLMFREMLLRNAIAFDQIEDALTFYKDIFRPFLNKPNHEVNRCISGMCGINNVYRDRYGKNKQNI